MREEGLEHDYVTVNTTIYRVIPLQLDMQKFIHETMTAVSVFRVNREKKKIQPTGNKLSSIKTIIRVLKDL